MSDTDTDLLAALYNYGLSGEPIRMTPTSWQPVVNAMREANVGDLPVSAVQPLLDAAFPDADYQATDVCLAHPPDPFVAATVTDNNVDVLDEGDADLGLSDSHFAWDFGDRTPPVAGSSAQHTYTEPGTYTIRCDVVVAGRLYSSSQDVEIDAIGAPPAPVLNALAPTSRVVGPTVDAVLHCYGANFTIDSVIVFAGNAERTDYVSPGEVTTIITGALFDGPDVVDVAVRNFDVDSNVLTFEFYEPAATEVAAPDEFDPGGHTVDEVLAYLDDHPNDLDRVTGMEEAGKARSTLLEKLYARQAQVADATT